MYEDTWYSLVPSEPKIQIEDVLPSKPVHHRRGSLLKQPNEKENGVAVPSEGFDSLFEESSAWKGLPEATVARRAKSYNDFYHVVRAQLTKDYKKLKREETATTVQKKKDCFKFEDHHKLLELDLLDASQEEFQLYRDQLALSERHLDGLLEETSSALRILTNLSQSFKSVESDTAGFQAQCEDILEEQRHLKALSDDVGKQLQYYSYLEPITRRLNAPGASSMIGDDGFVEMLTTLDSCIKFMIEHPQYRESEVYLSRFKSLHERTLNLFRTKFVKLLQGDNDKVKRNISSSKTLTMTDLFLYLEPDSIGDLILLRGTSELLIERGLLSNLAKSPAEYTNHLEVYTSCLNGAMIDWAYYRSLFIPDELAKILNGFTDNNYSTTFSHGVANAVMDVVEIECTKMLGVFQPRRDELALQKLDRLPGKQVEYKNFIIRLCQNGFAKVEPLFATVDLTQQVDLVIWLNGIAYSRNQTDDDFGDEERPIQNPGTFSSSQNPKQFAAWEISRSATTHVVKRLNDIAAQKVKSYTPLIDELDPKRTTTDVSTVDAELDEISRARAENLLGPGLSAAYGPVVTAVRLFIAMNDMAVNGTVDKQTETAYAIIHGTCEAIELASKQVADKYSFLDGSLFAIKNLVLLKNAILALDITGTHSATILDWTPTWLTLTDFRSRGRLLDIKSYYELLSNGTLLPRFVETFKDALTELDGFLRISITRFQEDSAGQIFNKTTRTPQKNHWLRKDEILAKLKTMFPQEHQLRETLWQAVEELVENWKT